MTFLNPIPALVAAAVCLPALVVLYLLKLRRRPVRVSSTLLWIRAVHDLQVNVPFKWLSPTWLFLLQLLVLACLLAALARPASDGGAGGARRVVLVIDRSASMSALDGQASGEATSRLDEARTRALAIVDELSRSGVAPAVGVVELASEARIVSPLSQSLGDARAAIAAITPSDQPGDLAAALRLVSSLLRPDANSESEGVRAEPGLVYLLSDGGFAGAEAISVSNALVRFERVGGTVTRDGPRDNLGITAIAARRDFDDPGVVRVFARVQNSSPDAITASIALTLDGAEVERRVLEVPGTGESGGSASLTLAISTRQAGVATVVIDREDLLASDNRASVVLAAATRPRVVLVVPDRAAPGEDGNVPVRDRPDWILPAALQELGVPLRIVPASAWERDAAAGESPRADLVVFDRVRPRQAPPVATMSVGAGLPGLDARERDGTGGTFVLSWMRSHPVLRSVALDAVYVARPLTITGAEGEGARPLELARGSAGPLMVLAEERGVRRLMIGFDLAQSNWPVQVSFPIFVQAAVDYLTLRGDDQAGRFFTTREAVEFEIPASLLQGVRPRLVVDGPVRLEVDASTADAIGGRVRVNAGVLERAGVYRVIEPADDAGVRAAAVNVLDETETRCAVSPRVRVSGEQVESSTGTRAPRELWPFFVMAAAVLLGLEWVINGWRMRV